MRANKRCKLIFKKIFQMQLEAKTRYLAEISPQAARNMTRQIFQSIHLLKECPRIGKLIDEDGIVEKRILITGQYLVLYILKENEVYIEMMLDEKMDYYNYI